MSEICLLPRRDPESYAGLGSADRMRVHGVAGEASKLTLEANNMIVGTSGTSENASEMDVDSETHLTPSRMADLPMVTMPFLAASGTGITDNHSLSMYRQVAACLMGQCRRLIAERDAMLTSLSQARDSLLHQQVIQMEEEVKYEDHISRLVTANLELRNSKSGALNAHRKKHGRFLTSYHSSLERKRKRSRSLDDIKMRETKRRCL